MSRVSRYDSDEFLIEDDEGFLSASMIGRNKKACMRMFCASYSPAFSTDQMRKLIRWLENKINELENQK